MILTRHKIVGRCLVITGALLPVLMWVVPRIYGWAHYSFYAPKHRYISEAVIPIDFSSKYWFSPPEMTDKFLEAFLSSFFMVTIGFGILYLGLKKNVLNHSK